MCTPLRARNGAACVWNAVMVSALTQASGREFHSASGIEVVNKDTDKEAHVPASVFIITDC